MTSTAQVTYTEKNMNFDFVRRQINLPPNWSSNVIGVWEDVYPRHAEAFLTTHYWSDSASINVQRVIGTDHWDYQGKTWLEFLQSGKRMQRNLQALVDNPNYYLELVQRQPSIFYNTTDGINYYIGADGNHRTCLAKFFLAEHDKAQLHNVTLNHYEVQTEFLNCFSRLKALVQQLALRVEIYPERVQAGRDDTAGWKMDRYQTFLVWRDLDNHQEIRLNYENAETKYHDLLKLIHHKHSTSSSLIQRLQFWKK